MEQAPTNLQTALNYVFAALCAVIVWNVTTTITEISGIREAINKTNAEISAIRIQISGDYITRAEYERKHEVILNKLDIVSEEVIDHNTNMYGLMKDKHNKK